MSVKIAVFGRQDTIDRIRELLPEQEVEMVPFVYTQAEQTASLLDSVFNCDIHLFTEELSYLYVKDIVEKKRIPATQVRLDPYMITASLYRMQKALNEPPQRIALDIFDEDYADEIIGELGAEDHEIHTFLHDPFEQPEINRLVSYYASLWNADKIDAALTSTEEITLQLKEKGIPAYTISIPDLHLKRAIQEAINLATLNGSGNSQIVTGYIYVKGITESVEQSDKGLEVLKKVNRIIDSFTAKLGASFTETKDHQFIIYGSEKLLQHLREHYRTFPLLQEMKSEIELPIHLGFGLGLNARESAKNADIALKSCTRSEHSICYIVNEREEIIGPIGVKKEIDTSSLYRALIHDARLNNELSYNFIDFITERNNEPFSTNDVAIFYKVTKRSAERTVNKLLTGNVIKIAGEERPYKKGRPRKLFTLNQ